MKKVTILISCLILLSFNTFAATHTIQVGVSGGLTFTPNSITTVEIGDVIHFEWVSGTHSTVSQTIPGGATSWNNAITSVSTSFDYTVTVAGTYNYQCGPHGAGMAGSFSTTSTPTSNISKGALLYTSFELSPNPTQDNITLKFSSAETFKANIMVFDETGKEKLNKRIQITQGDNNYSYSIATFKKGVYYLTIMEESTSYVSKKFIKE